MELTNAWFQVEDTYGGLEARGHDERRCIFVWPGALVAIPDVKSFVWIAPLSA